MALIGTEAGIILGYCLAMVSISIMGLRLYMRRYRGQSFTLSDYLTMFCCCCLVFIMNATLLCSMWGSSAYASTKNMTPLEKEHVKMGSKLSFAGFHIYAAYLWAQKAVVLCFIERLLGLLPWPYIWIRVSWGILIVTFIALELVNFTVCIPLHYYWQIEPPHTCSQAVYPLACLIILNCATDALLLILPLPWLFKVRQPLCRRIQLLALFSIGGFLIIIAILRLAYYDNIYDVSLQLVVNPIEECLSAIVANFPTLWSLRRAREPAPRPDPVRPVPRKKPRALHSILITETVDVEHCALEDRTQSTTTDQSMGDESDGHLVRNHV
ncbi:uncharacterized protein BO80DRAFT_439460 [Aspergillus ibericus CBS 121593]|uniref:Rhodopsin domain-containing protein n=1 Tax=Aspergillus ibericus CBS 121593 TaxID=1448316 RepID=A0A395GIZ6_9EURO|nr:hypothetical protein BO80DRAFT_439460 [Aspergillus ibericus CBS 121593]RAK95334.1 hypothetical protein BO80DRAFT_439460 [Aspergillus ibericus CBS 121593]